MSWDAELDCYSVHDILPLVQLLLHGGGRGYLARQISNSITTTARTRSFKREAVLDVDIKRKYRLLELSVETESHQPSRFWLLPRF